MTRACCLVRTICYSLLLLISSEMSARADIGVPMIFVTLPSMLIALIPIILIESFCLSRRLNADPTSTIKPVAIANVISTLVGIPITWLLLVLVQMLTGGGGANGIETTKQRFLAVTWQAPWLIPYESDLSWMIPAATLVLLVPFFFASWQIEVQVVKKLMKESPSADVAKGMFLANVVSYLLLGIIALCTLLKAIR